MLDRTMTVAGPIWRLAVVAVLLLAGRAMAEPKFAEPVKVTAADGAGVRIGFAVSEPTDVEVAVLDATGKVVRHLAAGVIGGQASPAEPLQAGLSQQLVWDGVDDAGRPVAAEQAKIRVRLGVRPVFDRLLLDDPNGLPNVRNLAVGPGGALYAFYQDPTANGNQGGVKLRLLDNQARHVRQLIPFSAELPFEKIKATGAFQDEAGRTVPQVHNWHTLSFYPDSQIARYRSMSQFACPVVDARGRVYWMIDEARLCSLDADGSIAYPTFMSEPLLAEVAQVTGGRPVLAISSDGKSLYAAGLAAGRFDSNKPLPVVLKIELATRKSEIFLGKLDQVGREGALLTSPRGLATADGLLYVADPDAGRVAVFDEAKRTLVGEMKMDLPHIVQVDPKTKAVYVCSYVPEEKPRDDKPRHKDANVLKFADYKAAAPLYSLALPRTGLSPNGGAHRIVLDTSGDRPKIWLPALSYSKMGPLGCWQDTGSGFEPVKLELADEGAWAAGPRDLLVDRARGELYVKVQGERWHQIDEQTGQLVRMVQFPKNAGGPYSGASGSQLGVDSQGNYITHCWGKNSGLMRWSRELKPLNWDGQETHRTDWGGMMTFQLNYMALHNDQIYVIKPTPGAHHLEAFDMALRPLRRVVWNVRRGSTPRVDARGNIYVTVPIRPIGQDLPEFFNGKLAPLPDYFGDIGEGHYWYLYMVASIVKFPPSGGGFTWLADKTNDPLPAELAGKPKQTFNYFQSGRYSHKPCEVQGAQWVRFGFSPYSETYPAGTPVCMCEGAGFDVDPYGRVFYPNNCQFRVEMIDTANNWIGTVGRYGNRDAKAAGGDVPLAWPTYVAVSDDYVYVNDTVNMRVNRLKLTAAAEQAVPAKPH